MWLTATLLVGCVDALDSGRGLVDAPPASIAWFGDPHVHTGASGDGCSSDIGVVDPGCGAFAALPQLALTEGLSWLVLTDHVNGDRALADAGASTLWRESIDAALAIQEPLVLAGAEVELRTSAASFGHRSVLFFDPLLSGVVREDVSPSDPAGNVADCAAAQRWAAGLNDRFGPTVLVPHHPAALSPMPTDWSCVTDADLAVEVYSHWGNSRAVVSAAQPWADYDPICGGPDDLTAVQGTVAQALTLQQVPPMAFLAGTDHHRTAPGAVCAPESSDWYGGGVTGVLLPAGTALTRESLYGAILARHTYASTGPRVTVEVAIFTRAGSYVGGMGDVVAGAGPYTVRVRVAEAERWDAQVVAVTLMRPVNTTPPGEVRSGMVRTGPGEFEGIVEAPDGDSVASSAYVELILEGADAHPAGCADDPVGHSIDVSERVWTSPTWFEWFAPGSGPSNAEDTEPS